MVEVHPALIGATVEGRTVGARKQEVTGQVMAVFVSNGALLLCVCDDDGKLHYVDAIDATVAAWGDEQDDGDDEDEPN